MLVLTRKRSEKIMIGDDIVITVVHNSRGSVKLGIEAPSDVRVLRAELSERPVEPLEIEMTSDLDDDVSAGPIFSADQFLTRFNAEYVAEVEDQVLTCLAK